MLHKVNKKLKHLGKDLITGDIVETGGWRNERLLLEHRYIVRTDAPHPTVSFSSDATVSKNITKSSLSSAGKKKTRKKAAKKKATKVT